MANEFKIKHGFISTGNGSIEGTLDVSTGININGSAVATRSWVTSTGLSGYATETYVTTQISNLVASAPDALNTLNELADALGDDPNFASTVNTNISGKVSKAGDTMTGNLQLTGGSYVRTDWTDGSNAVLNGTGVIFNRTSSYLRPDTSGAKNLYIGGYGIGDYDWGQVKINTPALYWNDQTLATQAWAQSQGFLTAYTETDTLASVTSRGNTTTNAITVGPLTASAGYFGETGSNPRIRIYTEDETPRIADTFADTGTDKSYIYFDQGTSSNDPGYIMHETSNSETNEGVLHLVPSDDNNNSDYVSIHGTNDPDALRLTTTAKIISTSGYQLELISDNGNRDVRIRNGASVEGTINTDSHGNSNQWNQAYNWGNHGSQGYARLGTNQVFTGLIEFEGGLLKTNKRVSAGQEYPLGHYTPGETLFELDPTWTDAELQAYFDDSNVSWVEDPTAPGGYSIYIDGSVNVGGAYSSGFPYIPIDEDGIYYMEVYIKNAGSGQTHYMGSIDYNESFAYPDSGAGNPGSYGYWVMAGTNPGSQWTKHTGYISGFSDSATGSFETGAKYWTPQALFNYGAGTGTRACWISGWKVIRVDQVGDRTFRHNVDVLGDLNVTSEATVGDKLYLTNVASSGQDGVLAYDSANTASGSRIFSFTRGAGNSLKYHSYGYHIWYSGPASGLSDSTARMILDSSGNLGIGTTSPAFKLDVQGGTRIQGADSNSEITDYGVFALENQQREGISFGYDADGNTAWIYAREVGVSSRPLRINGSLNIQNYNGNVGIGTTAPAQKLHVDGNIRVGDSADTIYSNRFFGLSNAAVYLASNSGHPIIFNAGGTEKMRILSSGLVGIGSTNPGAKLHVAGDARFYSLGSEKGISLLATNDQLRWKVRTITNGNGASYMSMWDENASETVRLSSTSSSYLNGGNVGIGTTSPYTKLDIRPDAVTGVTLPTFGQSAHSGLHIVPSGTASTEAWYGITFGNTAVGSSERERTTAGIFTSAQGSYGNKLYFATSNSWATGAVSRMMIDHNGKVGIGTTSPSDTLHVLGSTRIQGSNYSFNILNGSDLRGSNHILLRADSSYLRLQSVNNNISYQAGNDHQFQDASQNTLVSIKQSGRVGIGTTTPSDRLTIHNGGSTTRAFIYNSGGSGHEAKVEVYTADDGAGHPGGTAYLRSWGWGNAEVRVGGSYLQQTDGRMKLISSGQIAYFDTGNVGIGVYTPSSKLHISGTSTNPNLSNAVPEHVSLIVSNSDSAYGTMFATYGSGIGALQQRRTNTNTFYDFLLQPHGGRVAIGKTSATAALDVAGSIKTGGYFFSNELRANLDSGSRIVLHDGAGNMEFRTQGGTERMTITYGGNVGIGTSSPVAPLQVAPASDYKVVKLGGDTISHYTITGLVNHTLTLTCGSYYQAEVVITAHQTNGGEYNNLYIRGIWSNNHHSHQWDVLEQIGGLTGSDFNLINEQNDVENSGKLQIDHIYNDGSFALLTVRVTEYYGTHSYTIA